MVARYTRRGVATCHRPGWIVADAEHQEWVIAFGSACAIHICKVFDRYTAYDIKIVSIGYPMAVNPSNRASSVAAHQFRLSAGRAAWRMSCPEQSSFVLSSRNSPDMISG